MCCCEWKNEEFSRIKRAKGKQLNEQLMFVACDL